ncbi:MAG: hypothetical protein ACO1O6_10235 [Bacteroidota bacterium]
MINQIVCIVFILMLFSCKKNNFQECQNFDKLIGSWENIDGDTKASITVYKTGKIKHIKGLERSLKIKYSSCSYYQQNNRNIFVFDNPKSVYPTMGYYELNQTFDTLWSMYGSYDLSKDSSSYSIGGMRFIKTK